MSEKDARVAVCKVGEGPLRVLFVCHGNICRSTMAQFVFEDLVRRAGRKQDFVVDSAATSREEIGNAPHHGTVARLRRAGVPVGRHHARQVRRGEYADWDVIAYMDDENERGLRRIFGTNPSGGLLDPEEKVVKLLAFVDDGGCLTPAPRSRHGRIRDVADPWYTGNFDDTYRDVLAGCRGLLAALSS